MAELIRATAAAPRFETTRAPDISVIVPTYCEADNLVDLVVQIYSTVSKAQLAAETIVVDDNSPDNTCEICQQLAKTYPLQLVVRKCERGLSSAVIQGLRTACGCVLVVMDADLSHPPEKIPALVSAITCEGADFALGSRYIDGGGTDERWGVSRRLLSCGATWLVRPLTAVSDPMSGFFALRRESFHSIADQLHPIGYKIGLELLVKLQCQKVAQVPISFRQRQRGASKFGLREGVRFLQHVVRLYSYRLQRSLDG